MTRSTGAALVAACLVSSVGQAAPPLPLQIARARYVALGYDAGDRFISELESIGDLDRIAPADQVALQNLREQLETWEHFIVTNKGAELFIAVRTGRKVLVEGGGRVGTGSGAGTPGGPMMRAELSSGDDMLSIYEAKGGRVGMLLWRQRQAPGGAYPGKLYTQLKQEVESAPKK